MVVSCVGGFEERERGEGNAELNERCNGSGLKENRIESRKWEG